MSQELGRPIRYRRTGMDDFAAIPRYCGPSDQAVQDVIDALAAQDAGIYDADWAIAKIAPTDFRTLVPDRDQTWGGPGGSPHRATEEREVTVLRHPPRRVELPGLAAAPLSRSSPA